MPISMSSEARYVTQSGLFSSPMLGPLTSKRIEQYRKLGYYSEGIVLRTLAEKKRKPSSAKRKTYNERMMRWLKD